MKRWIRSLVLCGSLVGLALAPLSEAEAALNAYLKLEGERQGKIKGGVKDPGREGAIKVIGMSHELVSPRDPASGLPTGKRQHKPFVITKQLDRSSPLLYAAWSSNELIKSFVLDVYLPGAKGAETRAYTVTLTNASIASIQLVTDADGNPRHVVSFTYQKIEWVWNDGGLVAEDDWQAPTAKSK
jgi:type VI secretion system secreted protein Hcp